MFSTDCGAVTHLIQNQFLVDLDSQIIDRKQPNKHSRTFKVTRVLSHKICLSSSTQRQCLSVFSRKETLGYVKLFDGCNETAPDQFTDCLPATQLPHGLPSSP